MKAVIFTKYGSPEGLEVRDIPVRPPGPGEVRIRVAYATVTAGDTEIRRLALPLWLRLPFRAYAGLLRPRRLPILGMELSGEIDAVGEEVTSFAPGEAVFAATGFGFGAYAEYCCLRADAAIARKPPSVPFDQAAALPIGGAEALSFVRRSDVKTGDRVLVYGGSGSIGTFTVQLAARRGATVTAVCGPETLDLVGSLGATTLFDYTTGDFERDHTTYDVIIDAVGKSHFNTCLGKLDEGGRYVLANPRLDQMIRGAWISRRGRRRVLRSTGEESREALEELARLVGDGDLRVIVDQAYALDDVAAAHRYVDTGQKVGNVVLRVGGA